jgi:hypothetical protein
MTSFDQLSEEEQYKVYWLAQHLAKEGIDGIHFTDEMRAYLESGEAENDLEKKANAKLNGRQF